MANQVFLFTNQTMCDTCGKGHTSKKAVVQHLANSGCTGSTFCYCRTKLTMANASEHMLKCRFFGPLGCTECPDMTFKSLEKANNHAWSAHGGGKYTPFLQDTVEFKMTAQVGTRFAQMQIAQLKERARDNTLKRTILKELVKESNFAATNSKFAQLVEHFGTHRVVPLFTRTQGRMHDVPVKIADHNITVRVNLKDPDIHKIWNRLTPVVEFHAQALFSINHHVHTSGAVNGLAEQLTTLLEKLNIALPVAQRITSLCCKLVACFCSKFNPGVVAALIIDSLISIGVTSELAKEAWEAMKKHFQTASQFLQRKMFAQVGDIDPIASLTTVVAIMGGTMLMKKIPKESEINECVAGVTKLGGLVRGLQFAWQGLERLISFVLKKVFEWQTGLPAETTELEKYMDGIARWFKDVQDLVGLTTVDEIQKDAELCARLASLYREGLHFSEKAVDMKAPRELMAPFNTHWAVLRGLYEKATQSGAFRTGPRTEPLVIYLHGTSGVGKSGMMWPLAIDLLKVDGIPQDSKGDPDYSREVYMRNVEQKYWDGYKNQRIVIYDDFGQIVDSPSAPNPEFMEVIRTGNLAPFPLHMATIEEKAKTYFSSRVVIATSNIPVEQLRPESIHCDEAVKRRFDLVGEVHVKRRFATRGADNNWYLDKEKVFNITGSREPSLDVYEIWLKNPLTGELDHVVPVSFQEFSDRAVAKYKERFESSKVLHQFLKKYAREDDQNDVDDDDSLPFDDVSDTDSIWDAQALTSEEEQSWLDNFDVQVRLVGTDELAAWDSDQIRNFVEMYPYISSVIHPDTRFAIEDFNTDLLTDDEILHEWAVLLGDVNVFWARDAAERVKLLARDDILLRMSMSDIFAGIYRKAATRCRTLVARLKRESEGWLDKVKSFCTRVANAVKEHPFLSIGLAVVPILVLVAGSYLRAPQVVAAGPPLNHRHEGLRRGERVKHRHTCMWCGKVYEHSHVITGWAESMLYPQLCKQCDHDGTGMRVVKRDGVNGLEYVMGSETIFVPFELPEEQEVLETELARSGDVITQKKAALRTELTSSADPRTKRAQTLKTELTASADPRTKKAQTLRTELTEPKKKTLGAELTASGDPRTRRMQTIRTESEFEKRKCPEGCKHTDTPFEIVDEEEKHPDSPWTWKDVASAVGITAGVGSVCALKNSYLDAEMDDGDDFQIDSDSSNEIRAQLMKDPNMLQVSNKILNNMYNLEVLIEGEWKARIRVCFIRGRTALTAGHLIPHLEQASEIRIWNNNVQGGYNIPTERLQWVKIHDKEGESKDQMLIVFPSQVCDHPDITKNIASSADLTKFNSMSGCLISPAERVMMLRFGQVRASDQVRRYRDRATNIVYKSRQHYVYDMETRDGDCGAILMAVNAGIARKIIGIHVAGAWGLGMSSPLNIDDINRALSKVNLKAQVGLNLDPLLREMEAGDEVALPDGDFIKAGKSLYKVASPTKTALRHSLVYGKVTEPNTAPSALGPVRVDGEIVCPMQQGLKKAGKIPPAIDQGILEACINDVERIVNTAADDDHLRVLTDFEAVAGVEDDAFLAPINRKSSPGFPLTKDKGGMPGKTKWLGDLEYKLDDDIRDQMHEMIENAKENERTPTIWTDTLKDERRPLEKVRIGKTRVFAAGPMVYTLVFRKYFLGFAAHCAKNRIDNEISIGTNVYSLDWTRTAEKLCSKGDKVIAGDFSNFDGTLVLEILAEIVEIVNKFYNDGEENAQIRRVLWKEIVNSVHVCGDDVYLWTHSQPSGCPITAILNSLYNSISMRYVWMTVMPEEYRTMKDFNEHVTMVSYGDDNCVNISDDVIDSFNQLTIAEGYKKIGMTYTDETKSGEMIPYRSIDQISYLKRGFKWDEKEHQYIAPLDLSVVLEMINWVRGDFDLEEKTIENMETSAFELSLHGEQVFDQWIELYKEATRTFSKRPLLMSYNEYRLNEAKKYGRLAAVC